MDGERRKHSRSPLRNAFAHARKILPEGVPRSQGEDDGQEITKQTRDIPIYIDEAARNAINTNHTHTAARGDLFRRADLHDTIFSYRQQQNKGYLPETSVFRNRIRSLLPQGVAATRKLKANTERKKKLTSDLNPRGLHCRADKRHAQKRVPVHACSIQLVPNLVPRPLANTHGRRNENVLERKVQPQGPHITHVQP